MTMLMLIGFGIAQAQESDPNVIVIGDNGTTTLTDLPTTSLYKYSLTQQIYTKSEMGASRNITSISFFNAVKEKTRNLDIYLLHTRKTEFSITDTENNKSNDWIGFSEANKVFSGNVSFFEDDWTTIKLDKSFRYNGMDNLVLIVDDNSGVWSGGLSCRVFSAPSQALRIYSDNTNCEASGLSDYAGTIINAKNQIKFNAVDNSPERPSSIRISNLTSSAATVKWQGAGSKWNLQYKCTTDSRWTIVNDLTTMSYELTGLIPSKDYRVRVQSVYDDGKLSKWISKDFTTLDQYLKPTGLTVLGVDGHSVILKWQDNCGANAWRINVTGPNGMDNVIDVSSNPFTLTGLSAGTTYKIRVCAVVGGDVSKWSDYVYVTTPEVNPKPVDVAVSPTPNSGTISWAGSSDSYEVRYRKAGLPVFLDGFESGLDAWTIYTEGEAPEESGWVITTGFGASHNGLAAAAAYSYKSQTYNADNWLVSPQLDLRGILKFWELASSTNRPDSFEVRISTTGNAIEDFTKVLRPMQAATPEWSVVSLDLSSYAGKKGYIAIHHQSRNMSYLCIDDFGLYEGGEVEWKSVKTTGTEVTVTGLKSNTNYEYQVIGHMSGEADSASDIAVFTTLSENPVPTDLAVIPTPTSATITWTGYSDSYRVRYRTASQELFFDDFKAGLDRWTIYTEGEAPYENGWYPYYDFYGGMSAACARSWENDITYNSDNWLVTPQLDLQGTLKFKEYTYGKDPESYEVLLSTTGNAIEDFTISLRPMQAATDVWSEVAIDLSSYAGQQGYIAIHHVGIGHSFLIIDDFGIFGAASEPGEWITETTNKTSITISDLERNTKYDYQVYGLKAGLQTAVTNIASFTTADDIIDIVFRTDENNESAIVSNSGKYANVTLMGRTFKKDGTWQSLCLPFDVTVEGSVLEGAQVRTLESATVKNSVIILNCLKPVNKLTAGTPYIIKWESGDDIVDPVFNEVVVKNADNTLQVYNKRVGFIGIYQFFTSIFTNSNYYYLNGSPILLPFDYGSELHAFDAYFGVDSSLIGDNTTIVLNTGNEDELITGMSEIKNEKLNIKNEDAIYSLSGQHLNKVQKGINIINGRKIVIK